MRCVQVFVLFLLCVCEYMCFRFGEVPVVGVNDDDTLHIRYDEGDEHNSLSRINSVSHMINTVYLIYCRLSCFLLDFYT